MTKKFFKQQKAQQLSPTSEIRSVQSGTLQSFTADVESSAYVKEYTRNKFEFIPEVDYGDPANFVKFGSAKRYYVDTVDRIVGQYPYDGSRAERLKFENDLTPIGKHVLENEYPRKTGYANFGTPTWGTQVATEGNMGLSDDPQYVYFDGLTTDLVYDTTTNQVNSLEVNWASGSTIEFWMKKDAFPPLVGGGGTTDEMIFHVSGGQTTHGNPGHELQFYIRRGGGTNNTFWLQYAQYNPALVNKFYTSLTLPSLTTFADSTWHHYAITMQETSATNMKILAYLDGNFETEVDFTLSTALPTAMSGNLIGTIGASGDSQGGTFGLTGYGMLSGSIDEFRFWTTTRNAQQVGRNYFFDVGGGGNTDTSKVNDDNPLKLSVYYKFNEGITLTSSVDSVVLDYSGRLTNGVWSGYNSSYSRQTGSAITLSGVATEKGDPVIYSYNPDVVTYKSNMTTSGSNYDINNFGSLYNSIPQWIQNEDRVNGYLIEKTCQILGSYLDVLYGQIRALTSLKDPTYISGSQIKPNPQLHRNLKSFGFDIPGIFIDTGVIQELLSKDDKRLFEEKIFRVKNLIFQNIYNNLAYINKTKGTEKAFRNLFRCFGVDDEVIRLNMYADNQEYDLRENRENTAIKHKVVDCSGYKSATSRQGVVYQYPDPSLAASITGDNGYLPAATNVNIPFTYETEIFFPKFVNFPDGNLPKLETVSLFGIHSASTTPDSTDTTVPANDPAGLKVYAATNNNNKTYFYVTSSQGEFPTLTSSYYENVYENQKWNFALRIRPEKYPFSSEAVSSPTASYEFYGVNYDLGVKRNEFSVSASVDITDTAGPFLTGSSKRIYLGADRTNITGALQNKTNTRFISSRVWFDYLTDTELQNHAIDVSSFGRLHPERNTFVFEGPLSGTYIPKIETLALYWNFDNVTGSDSSGKFLVRDIISGSSTGSVNRYPVANYSDLVGPNYSGQGSEFAVSSADVVDFKFIDSSRQQLPENLYTSDLVKVLSRDDTLFTRLSRPNKYFFAVEVSMYDTISKAMLGFFASISDFNNLIGEPANMYRPNYKAMEKLRYLFFQNITNDPDVEKYINLYKWIDGALDGVLNNLIPASANAADKARSVIESHILERSKYRHKYTKIKELQNLDLIKGSKGDGGGGAGDGSGGGDPEYSTEEEIPAPPPPIDGTGADPDLQIPIRNTYAGNVPFPRNMQRSKGLTPNNRAPNLEEFPTFRKIRTPLSPASTNQSEGKIWWRFNARRDSLGELNVNAPVNFTRYGLQNAEAMVSSRSSSPFSNFDVATYRSLHAGVNLNNEARQNYYLGTFAEDATDADGISIEPATAVLNRNSQPYYDYSGSRDMSSGDRRRPPALVTDLKNSVQLPSYSFLPFTIVSSSQVFSVYQSLLKTSFGNFTIDITNPHVDSYDVNKEVPMQGLYTEEQVGGYQFRHGNLLNYSASGDTRVRKEGWQLSLDLAHGGGFEIKNPRIVGGEYDKDRPAGTLLRTAAAKSPVNIANIKVSNSTGINYNNYNYNYEIVLTSGRKENNRYYILSLGTTGSGVTNDAIETVTNITFDDRAALRRDLTGSTDSVIVNRFSAPGGPETSAENALDVESAEYSVYNVLPYRNLIVRNALQTLLTRHALSGGYDSVLLAPSGSYQKNQRNVGYQISSSLESPKTVYDNAYVGHGIPKSDVQYRWIADSWIAQKRGYPNEALLTTSPGLLTSSGDGFGTGDGFENDATASDYSPIYGYEYSASIRYVSGGHFPWIPTPTADAGQTVSFAGDNTIILGTFSTASNLFTTASTALSYLNLDIVPEARAEDYPGYNLNSFLLNNNGPYGWPSWKQLRVRETKGANVLRKYSLYQNIRKVLNDAADSTSPQLIDSRTDLVQSPVTIKHKKVVQFIDEVTGTIEYPFGNEYHYFARDYNKTKNVIENKNSDLNAPTTTVQDSDFYKLSSKWRNILYSEVLFPKDENVYRNLIRSRDKYVSFWKSDTLSVRTDNVLGDIAGTLMTASNWPMDVSVSGSGPTAQTDEKSGVIMRNTGSTGVTAQVYGEINSRYSFTLDTCRCKNFAQTQAQTAAFFTSYQDFSKNAKLIGQDESIIPEFTISDFVSQVTTDYDGDYANTIYEYNLTGSDWVGSEGSAEQVRDSLERYATTSKITYLQELKDFYGEPTAIRLKFDVVKQLLPKDGFYPQQRTVQLAQIFSQSYANSDYEADAINTPTAIPIGNQATYETTLMPFWAPGIGYNSIKGGIACDFPYKSAATGRGSASIDQQFDTRAPFDAILAPHEYVGNIFHICDSSGSKGIAMPTVLDSTGAVNRSDGVYTYAAHNFFSEVPNFFLDRLSTFKSSPQQSWLFRGPLSSSTGVKKFAMDVLIRKPADFLHYGSPAAFGPYPYSHHNPPGMFWMPYEFQGAYCDPTASLQCYDSTAAGNVFGGPNLNAKNYLTYTRATLEFDPTNLLPSSAKAGMSSFSFQDVIANSTIRHSNGWTEMNGAGANGCDNAVDTNSTVPSSASFMTMTASLDLFEIDEDDRWTIRTKWEAPVLNFADVTTETAATSASMGTSTAVQGMWHQFGDVALTQASGAAGRLNISVSETGWSGDSSSPTAIDRELTGSLVEAVGFSKTPQAIGNIKSQQVIEEAICAIPFYVDCEEGREKYFEIPFNIFEKSYSDVRQDRLTTNSVADMIKKMDKYVVPPIYDFVWKRDQAKRVPTTREEYDTVNVPFSMYISEFNSTLSQEDLSKWWQGVMPSQATAPETETVIMEHPITDGELLSPTIFQYNGFRDKKIPKDIRWRIFKIKKRAEYDYYATQAKLTGMPSYRYPIAKRFSFNWPYDYFSLVELGKMEVGFEVRNDSPDRIKNIVGGGYIKPEDIIAKKIALGEPLTISTPGAQATPAACSPSERQELARYQERLRLGVRLSTGQTTAFEALVIKCGSPYRAPTRGDQPGLAPIALWQPTCPSGEVYDEPTGRCKKIVAQKTCPDGWILDVPTGRCKEVTGPPPRCNDSDALNFGAAEPCRYAPSAAQQTQKGPMKFPSQPDCLPGYVYDTDAGECRRAGPGLLDAMKLVGQKTTAEKTLQLLNQPDCPRDFVYDADAGECKKIDQGKGLKLLSE